MGGLAAVRTGRRGGDSSVPTATISSTLRTDRPSATIRLGQALLRVGVVQAEQGPGVAGAEHARGDTLLDGRREVQQPEGVADVRARPAYFARELLVGGTEIVEKLLVGCGLLQRVELLAVHVLDQGVPEQVVVLRLLDDGADLGQPGTLSGAPPPFAHDELVPAGPGRTNHHRLQEADLPDGFREFVECLLVEHPPRLPGVRCDGRDCDFPVVGSEDLDGVTQGSRRCLTCRMEDGVRTACGSAVSEPRRLRDKRAESPP